MPKWLTDPLIRADAFKPDPASSDVWQSRLRGMAQGTIGAKIPLLGSLEENSSPLNLSLAALPWGKLAGAAKRFPAALRGLQQAARPIEKTADPLMDAVREIQTGPVGPRQFRPTNEPRLPSSTRGLGLEVERRMIEGQTMPRRKLLPSGGM